jgi:hypothetical protein
MDLNPSPNPENPCKIGDLFSVIFPIVSDFVEFALRGANWFPISR